MLCPQADCRVKSVLVPLRQRIIVVMGHSHYGPVVMVHMVVIMVHVGKSLRSTWVSRYGPPKKSLWSTIRNIRNNVEMGSKL